MSKLHFFKINHLNNNYVFRQISQLEKGRFNEFILNSPLGNIFQTYEWGQLKRGYGWHPLPMVLEKNNEILSAMLILKRTTAGMNIFYAPRGPVIDYYKSPELIRLLPLAINPLAQQEKVAFWRIDPELPISKSSKTTLFLRNNNFKALGPTSKFGGIQPKWVWRIPLSKDPEAQYKFLSKSARRNIKKAIKAGVTVREGRREDLPIFYKLLQATAQRNNFLLRNIDYYNNLWEHLSSFPGFKLLIAYHQEKPISTALAVGFGQGVWDIYAGNSDDNKDLGGSYLLTWELISWASKAGYSFYDLGGIVPNAPEKDPINGLKVFKSQFGGKAEEFIGEYDLIFNPMAYKIWNLGKQTFELVNGVRKSLVANKG